MFSYITLDMAITYFYCMYQERKSSLENATFAHNSDVNRQQWENILSLESLSTDKSVCVDDRKEILVTHQLPWLSDTLNNFKKLLDEESMKGKSHWTKKA